MCIFIFLRNTAGNPEREAGSGFGLFSEVEGRAGRRQPSRYFHGENSSLDRCCFGEPVRFSRSFHLSVENELGSRGRRGRRLITEPCARWAVPPIAGTSNFSQSQGC